MRWNLRVSGATAHAVTTHPVRTISRKDRSRKRDRNPQRPYVGHPRRFRMKRWSLLHGDMQERSMQGGALTRNVEQDEQRNSLSGKPQTCPEMERSISS